jgi:transcription termination/antitermination protein NusA
VAVSSRQDGLDPVGATVGQRGSRVQAVVAELAGEKIDVIPWNEDPSVFVANALSPAQVLGVLIDEEHRIANVTVPERMLSLAIGREGQNARLAARLTGWRIDIRSDVAAAETARLKAEAAAAPPEPVVASEAVNAETAETAGTAGEEPLAGESAPAPVDAGEPEPATAVAIESERAPAVATEPEPATADVAPADVPQPDAPPVPVKRSRKKASEEVSS